MAGISDSLSNLEAAANATSGSDSAQDVQDQDPPDPDPQDQDPQDQDPQDQVVQDEEVTQQEDTKRSQRTRMMTEKGLEEKQRTLKNLMIGAMVTVTKKRNELSKLMNNVDNLHLVKSSLGKLEVSFHRYHECCINYFDVIVNESEKERECKRFDDKNTSYIHFVDGVKTWVYRAELDISNQLGQRSTRGGPGSHVSSGKSSSSGKTRSSTSVRAREKAKLAALMAEREKLEEWTALQAKTKELELDIKIAKARARERVYAEESDSDGESTYSTQDSKSLDGQKLAPPMAPAAPPPVAPPVMAPVAPPVMAPVAPPPMAPVAPPPMAPVAPSNTAPVAPPSVDPRPVVNPMALPAVAHSAAPPPMAPTSVAPTVSYQQMDPNVASFVPYHQRGEAVQSGTQHFASKIDHQRTVPQYQDQVMLSTCQQLVSAIALPQPEVSKFSGDATEYHTFIRAFEARIALRTTNDADRLYYLNQHIEGEPKELIGGCLYMAPSAGYTAARALLDKEYGEPYKVSTAYVNKLLSWPTVKNDDVQSLKSIAYFLVKCLHAMQALSHMIVLNYAPNMQAVVHKLPTYLQNKWRERVAKHRRDDPHTEIAFKDLVEFIKQSSEAANDPIFGRQAMSKNEPKSKSPGVNTPSNKGNQRQKSTSFATEISPSISTGNRNKAPSKQNTKSKCILCNASHKLDDCDLFMKKSLDERRDFLKEKHICFGCLSEGHISKGCLNKLKCKECGKRHPSSLHDKNFTSFSAKQASAPASDVQASYVDTFRTYATKEDVTVLHSILPVKVYQKGSQRVVSTYAFYDGGSSGCFMSESLFSSLDAEASDVSLNLRTLNGVNFIQTQVVNNVVVSDWSGDNPVELPRTYVREEIPVDHQHIPRHDILCKFDHLKEIVDKFPIYMSDLEVGLLIGSNCPAALEPLQVVPSQKEGPFAVLLRHGWTVNGPTEINFTSNNISCNRIIVREVEDVKEVISPQMVLKMFDQDFNSNPESKVPFERGHSQEDLQFLKLVNESIQMSDGHYELPLPFRHSDVNLPNNKVQAVKRACWQKKRMLQNDDYHHAYCKFIDDLLDKGYAQRVPDKMIITKPGKVWYLPHHGVFNPNKGKLRVVFDCSATFKGVSLNSQLLQGPHLTNSLIGVLTRFREEEVVVVGDVEAMFHQVRVPSNQWDYLRFLWWPEGDLKGDLQEYQMVVHIFGAVSSPSICNFALRRIPEDNDLPQLISTTIKRNFYVDDCLKSVTNVTVANELVSDLRAACQLGGFRLTKFVSNNKSVLESIPKDERAKEIQAIDLDIDKLPFDRALGVKWCISSDNFRFPILLKSNSATRRGILSTVCSVFDPLGFLAPFILVSKRILQGLCKNENLGWDDTIPDEYLSRWQAWLEDLELVKELSVGRCLKPDDFGPVKSSQLHIFSDASTVGYASVAYLRQCNEKGNIHTSFLIGKARVAPIKPVTVPKLELTAASVSVQLGQMMLNELEKKPDQVVYHTDSTATLFYIRNSKKRYPVFVANRVGLIREFSEPSQWRYVPTDLNPADQGSRGQTAREVIDQNNWLSGPEFLKQSEDCWPNQPRTLVDSEDTDCMFADNEHTKDDKEPLDLLIHHYSSWHRLRKSIAWLLRLKSMLVAKVKGHQHTVINGPNISVEEMLEAENAIIRYIQSKEFPKELDHLQRQQSDMLDNKRGRAKYSGVPKSSSIYRLNPFISEDVIRVGGRLSKAQLPEETKHPVILPKRNHLTNMIIRHVHETFGHVGRNHVLSLLRQKYWVIHGNSAVRLVLRKCVQCRRLQEPTSEQKMADLPADRVTPTPPFTYVGVDFFGPFYIKDGRKTLKRYGALFTCLVSRAIHIESSNSLDTASFIHALRRFMARRGYVKEIRCDNGTNFVGTEHELRKAIMDIDQEAVRDTLLGKQITWKFNPPGASHMGGVWERQIKSVRKVLSHLLFENGDRIDDEAFRTLLCEVEAIVNSRPLSSVSDDPNDMNVISPSQLLTLKSVIIPPPGQFQREDMYARKRWRRIQFLADQFWHRWRREYLTTLQPRQKWNKDKRNMMVGDIVLLQTEGTPRTQWPLGRVIQTEPDGEGYVRSIIVKTQTSTLRRPITKVVLLIPVNE